MAIVKKKRNNIIWWIVGAVILILAMKIGIDWWNRDIVPVKTAVVQKGLLEEIISASGNVNAPVYELGTKLGGKIAVLNVREGDRVRKGEVLAELDDTSHLVSPDNGMVAKLNYVVGETIPPGTPAIIVANYGQSWVEAQIDEVDIANVRMGDKVTITSDVYQNKSYEGVITWLTPLAELRKVGGRVKMDEESYVFLCKIKLLGMHEDLKVNMQVNADIVAKRSLNALIVPREAIFSKDDTASVFVINKNRAVQKEIKIGIRSYSSVEAVSGMKEGDVVAVSNVAKLKDKVRVKIER